jgi:hypothetical protein
VEIAALMMGQHISTVDLSLFAGTLQDEEFRQTAVFCYLTETVVSFSTTLNRIYDVVSVIFGIGATICIAVLVAR